MRDEKFSDTFGICCAILIGVGLFVVMIVALAQSGAFVNQDKKVCEQNAGNTYVDTGKNGDDLCIDSEGRIVRVYE